MVPLGSSARESISVVLSQGTGGDEIVYLRGTDAAHAANVASLLVLVLHLTATHLLLELFLQEIDFELKLLLKLFALGLFFDSQVSLLLQLFLVLVLEGADFVLSRADYFPHHLLLLQGRFGIFLRLLRSVLGEGGLRL